MAASRDHDPRSAMVGGSWGRGDILSRLDPDDARLLTRLPRDRWSRNGVPEHDEAAARERAALLVEEALRPWLGTGGLRASPLGAGWSRDLDVHVAELPDPAVLRDRGWLPLDPLLRRLGSPGTGRWAVRERGEVLAAADLTTAPWPSDPVAGVLDRCRRRGEVRLREVLELRVLARRGRVLPRGNREVVAAARVEAGLGGTALSAFAAGDPLPAPASLPASRLRHVIRGLRARPRLVVAISGVDGAGKSSLCRALARDLTRAGVPASIVWTRPGMGLRWLGRLARAGKRLLREDPSPALRPVARGEADLPRSRRGVLGWTWALAVTAAFLSEVRRAHRRARGVVLFDRHMLDALVTLDVAYRGVDLRLHRALVRRLLPPASLALYLDVPPEVAVARKPDEVFGERAIRAQIAGYRAIAGGVVRLVRLDARRAPEELAARALRVVLAADPPE